VRFRAAKPSANRKAARIASSRIACAGDGGDNDFDPSLTAQIDSANRRGIVTPQIASDGSFAMSCKSMLMPIVLGRGNRFLHPVGKVLPRRGDALPLPFDEPEMKEAAN